MVDIVLEVIRAVLVAIILFVLVFRHPNEHVKRHQGWSYLIFGFSLIFFGMVIDVTDNFEQLNKYIVVGDTPTQAFLEKFVGYLAGFVFLVIGFWQWLPVIEKAQIQKVELENTNLELKESLDRIKTLEGIVPICSYCKKIRDDEGYWKQVEEYMSLRTKAHFSHSICPHCIEKEYGKNKE